MIDVPTIVIQTRYRNKCAVKICHVISLNLVTVTWGPVRIRKISWVSRCAACHWHGCLVIDFYALHFVLTVIVKDVLDLRSFNRLCHLSVNFVHKVCVYAACKAWNVTWWNCILRSGPEYDQWLHVLAVFLDRNILKIVSTNAFKYLMRCFIKFSIINFECVQEKSLRYV